MMFRNGTAKLEATTGTNMKTYRPFISPTDPCPPITVKAYSTPPNLYLGFQPVNLPQFSPSEALQKGTLWPALYSPYESKATFVQLRESTDQQTDTDD